jgi:CBS domain containing-hemolysin-like protein
LDPGPTGELLGLIICFALTAIASAADAALSAISRHRLNMLVAEGTSRAQMITHLLDDPARIKATTLTIDTLAKCGATALTLALLDTRPLWWQRLIGVVLVLLALLVFGEALPKMLAAAYPDRTALRLARPLRFLAMLVSPITAIVGLAALPVGRMLGSKPGTPLVTEEELKLLVNVGAEEGLIEKEEREMIEGILIFGDTLVREVMVPRIDIAALDVNSTISQSLDFALAEGHSRIPVYEGAIDRVIGVLYVRELLPLLRDGRLNASLRDHLRPAYFVPESMKVDSLLRNLKSRKVHLAIVVDEYGGTAGLVTIEDLLEEIVGEIQDEYDVEEPLIQSPERDVWIVDARVSIDDLNAETGLHLATDEGDSLGGLVYEKLEKIPSVGDSIEVGNVLITVQSVQGLRPEKLRLALRTNQNEEPVLVQELGDGAG